MRLEDRVWFQELQPRILFVIAIFVLCFIVGVCGNSSILTIIRGVIVERRSSSRSGRRQGEHTILYIAALCVVDFLMSLSLPPAILVRFLITLHRTKHWTIERAFKTLCHHMRFFFPSFGRDSLGFWWMMNSVATELAWSNIGQRKD